MGNVQSEATQESETTKDGEEKANLDGSKPDQKASATKREMGSRPLGPQSVDPRDASRSRGNEPGGGDRPSGAAEMGKSNPKKSKLKLASMWPQNTPSGGMKEASLCDKGSVMERRGSACLSRADLQSGQNIGSILPEEQKGLETALSPPQGVAHNPRELSTRTAAAKAKSRAESASPGPLLQPARLMEPEPVRAADEDEEETEVSWIQYLKRTPKVPSVPSPQKQPTSSVHGPVPLSTNEDALGASKFPRERNTSRPAPSGCVAPSGGKKVLLSWGSGHQEKEQAGQRDSAPGSDGDSKGPAPASQSPAEDAATASSPADKHPVSRSEAKAGGKNEATGAEAVSSETMQELLERGLNFLYKVTIQPGQWPPNVKAVKQKAGPVPPGISYADVLKQCPQKKAAASAPASAPALPKTLHQLPTGKKLPSLKGLKEVNTEEQLFVDQLFLEHFKKVAPKEPAGPLPSQQVVTFLEELSSAKPKRPEWERPRPPTPYPQRRKGQGRKLPKLGAAVSQVVAFLGSDSKCNWFVHDESQMSSEEAAVAAEEEGRDPLEQSGTGSQEAVEAGFPSSVTACMLDEEITVEFDDSVQISCRKSPGLLEGAKGTALLTSPPCNSAQGVFSPPETAQGTSQKEDRPPMPAPKSPSASETPEVSSPKGCAPCAPAGLPPEQKAPALAQARPKVRKQGPTAPKSKEKFKSSGQAKVKVPKGQKQWPRAGGAASPLRFEGVPVFAPCEKVTRPFYFGEALEEPLSRDEPAATKEDAAPHRGVLEQDREEPHPTTECRRWPAFQVADSCPRKCFCKHQDKRKLPKNVVAWLNPTTNHLAEPPWVATALLAVSLVAGTKFCLDSYKQERVAHED